MKAGHWRRLSVIAGLGALISATSAAQAQTDMMSAAWAKSACDAWNAEPVLTDKLVESGWMKNNANRGFKVMQVYRTECSDSPRVELRVAERGGKARCVYGGKVETAKLDLTADYVMHAETERWREMGRGEYGPMRAMMFGNLQFDGPSFEAMNNMEPFEKFLLLVGKVPASTARCPAS